MVAPTKPKPPEIMRLREGQTRISQSGTREIEPINWFGLLVMLVLLLLLASTVGGIAGSLAASAPSKADRQIGPAAIQGSIAEEPTPRGPIRWAANQWNEVGYRVNQMLAKAERRGHIDAHIELKGPKGQYTLLQFELQIKVPK